MNMNEYQALAARTIREDLDAVQVAFHALHGMASEVGEIHGLYQKTYQGHELHAGDMKHEIGDLLWFIAEYCTACGWQLEDVAQMNIEKLLGRYPDGFDAERSIHRAEES